MRKINILSNNGAPNSKAFNCPLIISKPLLKNKGFKTRFFNEVNDRIFEGNYLFINSNVFRTYWAETSRDIVFSFLEKARKASMKIVWFDTTDSTWSTQFQVLPYVDLFLKSQIFADKEKYLTRYNSGRIFTDYFADLYDIKETPFDYLIPEKQLLDKVDISWNTCFENYTESRYGLFYQAYHRIRKYVWNIKSEKLNIDFYNPKGERKADLSCRVGLSHNRVAVVAHRKEIIKKMEERKVECGKIPLPQYFDELRNSKIGVGPFGVGEITLRDFEIIICGALLLKPDLSHMDTWPNLFIPDETYVAHKWDLSDFDEKIDSMLAKPELSCQIAENALRKYKHALSNEGMLEFTDRLIKKITSI